MSGAIELNVMPWPRGGNVLGWLESRFNNNESGTRIAFANCTLNILTHSRPPNIVLIIQFLEYCIAAKVTKRMLLLN